MRFLFDELKAAQAAAYLLKRHGGRLNYTILTKLLYLADRRSLLEIGRLISGDELVSMPQGPVLSRVYELINLGPKDDAAPSPWFAYIMREGRYEVALCDPSPSNDELSKHEMKILDEIDEQFGKKGLWDLVDYAHTLEEWVDPKGSSSRIDPETILRVESKSQEEIEAISRITKEVNFLQEYEPRQR